MFHTISVVIPAYNEERFIEDCLHSVYLQDYPKDLLEVTVVDGNSHDRTKEIIGEMFSFVHKLTRTYFRHPHSRTFLLYLSRVAASLKFMTQRIIHNR